MTGPSATGTAAGWRWSLLLPPDWATLPCEPEAGRAAVRRLLDRQLARLPRDQVATVRRGLELQLRGLLRQAAQAGAVELHTSLALVRGLPVTGTCSVSVLRGGVDDPRLVAELAAAFAGDGDAVELDVRPLAGLPALRRRRSTELPGEEGQRPVPATTLDWAVPLPDGEGAVLLSFSTVTAPVADELVALFDAIAGSLQLAPAED